MQTLTQSTSSVPLVRSLYIFPHIELMRRAGTPVDRELRKARLPTLIEELPEAYVSTDLVFRFLSSCVDSEGNEDIGFDAGWQLGFEDLGPDMYYGLQVSSTLKTGLETFSRLVCIEDSEIRCTPLYGADISRIYITQYVPPGRDSRIAEWQNLKAIIEVIRRYTGTGWLPAEIGLQSAAPLSFAVRRRLDPVKIKTGQPTSYVELPSNLLAKRLLRAGDCFRRNSAPASSMGQSTAVFAGQDDMIARLNVALTPYLAGGYPTIDLAAEIAGTSVRNLQRRLDRMQTSYSKVIDALRIERALSLLQETDLKILDIALMLGYRDPSNFARAIRRITGSSPRDLRRHAVIDGYPGTGTK